MWLPELVRKYYFEKIYYPFAKYEDDLLDDKDHLFDDLEPNDFLELLNKSLIDKYNKNIPPNHIARKFIIVNIETHWDFLVKCN